MIFRETSFRESDCPGETSYPGNIFPGKWLSGETSFRETSFRESSFQESDFPGNVRKPITITLERTLKWDTPLSLTKIWPITRRKLETV